MATRVARNSEQLPKSSRVVASISKKCGWMIDWSKLEPGQRDKTGSFEELCYQVEKDVHGSQARFVSVDDSGGGDGVEFCRWHAVGMAGQVLLSQQAANL